MRDSRTIEAAVSGTGGSGGAAVPERSLMDLAITLVLFLTSCLYLRLVYDYIDLVSQDEGIILQGAQRIVSGQMPYRDFFTFYTPGSYYWLALFFKLLGSSILVGRALLLAYGGLFAAFTYLVARRVCSRLNSLLAACLVTMVCVPYFFQVLHNWDSTLWACLALYAAVRWLESDRWAWALASGSLAALTCLFEQSKGAGLVLGLALGLGILVLKRQSGLPAVGRWLPALLLGFAWPFLLTLAYFGVHHALSAMIADLVWPLRHYAGANRLPYGGVLPSWRALMRGPWAWRAFGLFVTSPVFIVCALPLFAVCALAWFALRSDGASTGPRRYYVLVSATLSGLVLSVVATGRPDTSHIIFDAPLFLLVLAWMAEAAWTPFLRSARTLGTAYVLASSTALGLALVFPALGASHRLETRRGVLRAGAPCDAFDYIQARVPAGETILVYPYAPLYYYLTATYSVSRYDYLQLGMHDSSQFHEALLEIEAAQPRFVLFNPSFIALVPEVFPATSVEALAAPDPVADYILAHYRPCRAFWSGGVPWHVVFMVRADLGCS
jgi:4-amino-4-deoxy-L-arabinose transferase-like glycosyltransferase